MPYALNVFLNNITNWAFWFTVGWYMREAYGWWKGRKEPDLD